MVTAQLRLAVLWSPRGRLIRRGFLSVRGTATTYLHSGLKNAFAQSGTSQTVTATREYDAFGNVMSPTGTWAGPFGYAGKFGYQSPSIPGVSTPDEGITLMGHRYYDSSTGRFFTRDPIFDGRNWYCYGGGEGNPLTQADPTGLVPVIIKQLLDLLRDALFDAMINELFKYYDELLAKGISGTSLHAIIANKLKELLAQIGLDNVVFVEERWLGGQRYGGNTKGYAQPDIVVVVGGRPVLILD